MRKPSRQFLYSVCIGLFVLLLSGANPVLADQVTERYGGSAATLDVANVMDDVWFSYYSRNTSTQVLYSSYGKPYEPVGSTNARRIAVKFDLSSILPGTAIVKAAYVLPLSTKVYPLSTSSYEEGLSLYRILDPSGTGNWDIATLNTRYKRQDTGGEWIPWTGEDGTFADCVDPEPVQTLYSVGRGDVQFYYFDITALVREWVDTPESNLGFSFDETVISDRTDDSNLRPYLEITYETASVSPPAQVAGIEAFHRQGQTFITWPENGYTGKFFDANYRIYRHTQPINQYNLDQAELIAKVTPGSAYNANRSYRSGEDHNYKIIETDPELADGTGLFVYTPDQSGDTYYAVTYVEEGYENRIDFSGSNALSSPVTEQKETPGAVLQNFWDNNGDTVQEFVHFADDSMSYRPGHGFNFMLNVDSNASPTDPVPLEIALTGRTANYRQTWVYTGMATIWYSDYLPPTRNMPLDGVKDGTVFSNLNDGNLYDSLQTWYSGCSSTYKTQEKLSDGLFVPYTENRILHAIKVAKDRYNINDNRIYLRGGSMGGTGSMSLGLKYPDVFASVTSTVGCPNWRLNIHEIDNNYEVVREGWRSEANRLWGSQEDASFHENGTPVWDWMNAGWYAKNHMDIDLPFLSLQNGKLDGSIVFFPHVPFYHDYWESKQAFAARFFDSGHSGGSSFDPRFGTLLKNESYPALSNVSIDDDPGQIHEPSGMTEVVTADPLVFTGDAEGELNGYSTIEWSRALKQFSGSDSSDDILDQAELYEMAFRIEPSASHTEAAIDITPRKLQQFQVVPFENYYWENKRLSDSQVIQNGTVTADVYGLITIPGFEVEQTSLGNKLIIIPFAGQEPIQPVLDPIGDKIIGEGGIFLFVVTAYDGNNDPLTFSSSELPAGAIFDPQTGQFSWAPENQYAGNHTITFTASDGVLSDSETITLSFDVSVPEVVITPPSGGLTLEQGLISLNGNATDDVGIDFVTCQITYPDGTTEDRPVNFDQDSWDVSGIYLAPGNNIITITATDPLGHSNSQAMTIERLVPPRSVVYVSTVAELEAAISNLVSNTEIRISDGTYDINTMLMVGGNWGSSETLSNVKITSNSQNREAVILKGTGMYTSGNANILFLFRNIVDFTLSDLTIKEVYYHPIQAQGENGANRPTFKNLHIIDAGEQFIKVTRSTADQMFCNRGVVEDCYFEFTEHAKYWSSWGYYTDAVDVLGGDGWIIRDNTFYNIRAPHDDQNPSGIAGAVILMWHESSNTIVEQNRFIECDMGIQFGNPSGAGVDHDGGIIRNNFFYRTGEGDVAISLNRAANVKVLHNTVMQYNTFPWTIEYRYLAENGEPSGIIEANLTDGPIQQRNGGVATVQNNMTDAISSWFVDDSTGDLHLAAGSPPVNQITRNQDALNDIDNDVRPSLEGLADIGADEYMGFDPDMDQDQDVDGLDLARMIIQGLTSNEYIDSMANAFGQ